MRDPHDDAAFTGFVVAMGGPLLRTAWLLAGDARAAEDLLRATLDRAYAIWPRPAESGDPAAAVLRLLVTAYLQGRRPARRPVAPALPANPGPADPVGTLPRSQATRQALDRLPAPTRTALVLAFADALDEPEVARAMGCRRRTARAEVAAGLFALGGLLDPERPEADLAERLRDLADDLVPGDPLRYADAARARHERRHGRLAVVATVVVLLVVGAIPVASRLVSLAGPPAGAAASRQAAPSPPPPLPASPTMPTGDDSPGHSRAAAELADRLGVAGAAFGFLQNCLIGTGIQVSVRPDGSFVTTPRPDHEGDDAALVHSCFDRVTSTVPLSEDARSLLLSDWTDTYLCLVVHGWVAARQPPQDLTLQSGLLAWNPYEGIPPAQLAAARGTCPVRTY